MSHGTCPGWSARLAQTVLPPAAPLQAHGALPGYDSSAESPLRRPLLPASGARLAESSASEWDEEGAWVSSSPRRGSGWWLGTAVLTTSMLGAGEARSGFCLQLRHGQPQ